MITNIKQSTIASFSKEGDKATLSVSAYHNQLILQELSKEKRIGDEIAEGDAQELPKIILDFRTTKSIDIVIAILERVKKNMTVTERGLDFAQAS